jgi:hypothetical protein
MPPNTVYVGRPTIFGNPLRWQDCLREIGSGEWARGAAVDTYRDAIYMLDETATAILDLYLERFDASAYSDGRYNIDGAPDIVDLRWIAHNYLRDKHLACWCPINQPCHADILLEVANGCFPWGENKPSPKV